jgi:tetratricopeptide (TPR) repeat protein
VEAGFAHHQTGALGNAEQLYRAALLAAPDDVNALQLLGALCFDLGRAAEAVPLYERAQAAIRTRGAESAQHAALYGNLALALRALDRGDDAIASYRHGLTLDPSLPDLYAGLAGELHRRGEFTTAAAEYDAALALQPLRADWLHNLAAAYAGLGAIERAVPLYRRALAIDRHRPDTLRALGIALVALARPSDAVYPLSELTALKPADADARSLLAAARLGQGHVDGAETDYREALRLDPAHPDALYGLGVLLLREREDPLGAVDLLERLATAAPAHVEVHSALGSAYRALARFEHAIASYERYVERAPQSALAYMLLGRTLGETARKEEAIAAIEAAFRLKPEPALAHLAHIDLGNALQDLGRIDAAQIQFRRALDLESLVTRKAATGTAEFSALLLLAPGALNTPHEYLVSRSNFDAHVLLLLPGATYDVPYLRSRADVVVNLVSDAEQSQAMLPIAAALIDRLAKPVVNHPEKIAPTDRGGVAALLATIPGCRVACTRRVSAISIALSSLPALPFLARLAGRHGGEEFELIEQAYQLEELMARHPGKEFYLIEYLDYRSADGFFRKYRFFFVGDEILPYHLAIGDGWKLHHFRTNMAHDPAQQSEEEAFLTAPERVFTPAHFASLDAIRVAIGLDFFGIDCGLDRDGRLVVFEANATMLVHNNNHALPYKSAHARRIKAAFARLLARRANNVTVSSMQTKGFAA